MDTTTTAVVWVASVLRSGQMIFLNSDFRPCKPAFLRGFFRLGRISHSNHSFTVSNYFVSLCSVCLLQNLQYFLVSIRSG